MTHKGGFRFPLHPEGAAVEMGLGDNLRITLFGESHGPAVGALVEGIPTGTPIDVETLMADLSRRKPGRRLLSARAEDDEVEILSGVHEGHATGWPILLVARNQDARTRDYAFLPDHPRPGHADLPESERSDGKADLRGGGTHSGRLTLGIVAGSAIVRPLLDSAGIEVTAHVTAIGEAKAAPLTELLANPSGFHSLANLDDLEEAHPCRLLNCLDEDAAAKMLNVVFELRSQGDSIGSTVEAVITGLPLGLGEPWFEGIEPALARALMAIPAARAVEFGRGTNAATMRGSEHNDPWVKSEGDAIAVPSGDGADGALGGLATGAPLRVRVHFKPPSSISIPQETLNVSSGEMETLVIGGRHDPTIGPRAAPVVEGMCRLVVSDLLQGREQA